LPAGPTGLPPWPDFLVRLTRIPVVSIALIRGRATGNGSEITLACDMSFASREKAILSQWEVGVGMVAGGPMARLPQLIGRNRALEALLRSEGIRADQAEAYGHVNRALPDADLDAFVEALATRIAGFDKWAIANTKRLVNTSLPPDVELGAGWDACIAWRSRASDCSFQDGFNRYGFGSAMVETTRSIYRLYRLCSFYNQQVTDNKNTVCFRLPLASAALMCCLRADETEFRTIRGDP